MGSAPTNIIRLQSTCYWLAVFDIILYFGSIITSVIVETVISERRPMKFEISQNGTFSVAYGDKDELMAVWDYLSSNHYSSSVIYNAVYMSLVLIAVTYLIVEVWLCCVLIRGATEKSLIHCKKWIWWRVLIIVMTLAVAASDLYQMQYTFTLLFLIPLNIYRVFVIFIVLQLINQIQGEGEKIKMYA